MKSFENGLRHFFIIIISQKETPSDAQLHYAAFNGKISLLRKVLDSGKVHVDCKDKVSLINNFYNKQIEIY